MLLFPFKKSQMFWFFLFSKKFIISHEKVKKTNNSKSKSKLLSTKSKKNKRPLNLKKKKKKERRSKHGFDTNVGQPIFLKT